MAKSGVPQEEMTSSMLQGQDIHQDSICHSCDRKGKHQDAIGFCQDCNKFLCDSCYSNHLHGKQTKHHFHLDWKQTSSFKTSWIGKVKGLKNNEDVCTEKCLQHEKVIEYFCPSHDAAGCSECMAKEHKDCQDVKYIQELSTSLDDNDDYKNMLYDLIKVGQRSRRTMKELKESKEKSHAYNTKVVHTIRQFRNQINKTLDQLETNMITQAETAMNEDIEGLDFVLDKQENALSEVVKLMSMLHELRQSKQNCRLFLAMKSSQASLKPLQQIIYNIEAPPCMQYKFEPNQESMELLESVEILGKISKTISEEFSLSTTGMRVRDKVKVFENQTNQEDKIPTSSGEEKFDDGTDAPSGRSKSISKVDLPVLGENYEQVNGSTIEVSATSEQSRESLHKEATFVSSLCAKSDKDSYPVSISSTALLDDNTLVAIDTANWRIKLISMKSNKLIQNMYEPGCPWDVTTVEKDKIAVTFPALKKIMIFKYQQVFSPKGREMTLIELKKEREFTVRGNCYGIAYSKEKLFVTFAEDWLSKKGPLKVEIMNLYGNVVQNITAVDKNEPLFLDPKYVAVSEDEKMIYISDWGDNTVTIITADGQQVAAMYEDNELQKPTKLFISNNNTMYICGQNSGNVHRITPEGTKLQVLLSGSGLEQPRSISYCDHTCHLYIGMLGSDYIQVYQLS